MRILITPCHASRAALALMALLPISTAPVYANAIVGGSVEGFAGSVSDARPLGDREDDFSGGVLPSLNLTTDGGLVVQLDGILAKNRRATNSGAAGHIGFMVQPAVYVGAYVSYHEFGFAGGIDTVRAGGEVDARIGGFRLSAVAGHEEIDRRSTRVTVTNNNEVVDRYGHRGAFFSMADIGYDGGNARFSVGHRYLGKRHAAAASAELGFAPNAAAFVEGRLGERDYRALWAGLRLRFGGAQPVAGDAPRSFMLDNRLKDDLFGAGNSRRRLFVPLPPPEDEDDGSCGGYGSCGAMLLPTN